jgi:hypothetical protein
MILKVYVDESLIYSKGRPELIVVAGYVGLKEVWEKLFSLKWSAALSKHNAPHFHFREFNAKANFTNPESPYCNWDDERRDNFFYDLALAIPDELIPVAGAYNAGLHDESDAKGDPDKLLFGTFFNDVRDAISTHWPTFTGKNFEDKIEFLFDHTDKKKWRESLHVVHDFFSKRDSRFGELSFQNDKDPNHFGLQAADLLAGIYRQAEQNKLKEGGRLQLYRIVDLILFRNLFPKDHPLNLWNCGMSPAAFRFMIEQFRIDEKKRKREWLRTGKTNQPYLPLQHYRYPKII